MSSTIEVMRMVADILETTKDEIWDCEPYNLDRGEIEYVLSQRDYRWNALIEHDVDVVRNGYEPKYFASIGQFMNRARNEMGINFVPEPRQEGMMPMVDGFSEAIEQIKRELDDPIQRLVRMTWACPKEQSAFYRTDTWKDCAASARYKYWYKCGQCGKAGAGLHVHHSRPIMTGYSYQFRDNFDDYRMGLLCEDCHMARHKKLLRQHLQFIIADPETVAEQKRDLHKMWKEYHERGYCEYCNSHN